MAYNQVGLNSWNPIRPKSFFQAHRKLLFRLFRIDTLDNYLLEAVSDNRDCLLLSFRNSIFLRISRRSSLLIELFSYAEVAICNDVDRCCPLLTVQAAAAMDFEEIKQWMSNHRLLFSHYCSWLIGKVLLVLWTVLFCLLQNGQTIWTYSLFSVRS